MLNQVYDTNQSINQSINQLNNHRWQLLDLPTYLLLMRPRTEHPIESKHQMQSSNRYWPGSEVEGAVAGYQWRCLMLAVVLDRVDVAQDESDRTKIGRFAIT